MLSTGLFASYKLNEGAGLNVIDSSNHRILGTITGAGTGYTWVDNSLIGGDAYGNALKFDGTGNDYIKLSQYLPDHFNSYTCAAWINVAGVSLNCGIFEAGKNNTGGFRCRVRTDSGLQHNMSDDNSNLTSCISSASLISLNTWYHVAFTAHSKNFMRIYLNGAIVKDQATAQVLDYTNKGSNTTPLIGTSWDTPSTEPFNGTMYNVRIYTRALSDQEVYDLYRQ